MRYSEFNERKMDMVDALRAAMSGVRKREEVVLN
jgi:hypothetical protein